MSFGTFSSRKLEQATYDSVAFRFITGDRHPDHDTIAHFRKRFLVELEELFLQILVVAKAMGVFKLGTVSLDGTKIKANASKHKAMSWKHANKLEEQLHNEVQELLKQAEKADVEDRPEIDIPEELARREDRLAAIKKAREAIKKRAQERFESEQSEQEVIDNSVDEALAGFACRIDVVLHADGALSVTDDGRGMPVDRHPQQNKPGVEVILSTLHAGGKFSNENYRFSGRADKLADPQFSGQTKERLSSREAAAFVAGVAKDAFSLWLNQHTADAEALAELCISNAQRRLRRAKKVLRKKVSTGPALPGKLADCCGEEMKRRSRACWIVSRRRTSAANSTYSVLRGWAR